MSDQSQNASCNGTSSRPLLLFLNNKSQVSRAIETLALPTSTSVPSIRLKSRCYTRGATMARVLKALGSCAPRSLDIDMPDITISGSQLQGVLSAIGPQLNTLRLNCRLDVQENSRRGSPSHYRNTFHDLQQTLQNLPVLEMLTLKLTGTPDVNTCNSIVISIARNTRLKTVALHLTHPIERNAIQKLASMPILESLTFSGNEFDSNGHNITTLCLQLQQPCTNLKFLKIAAGFADLTPVANMLAVNTTLEQLSLNVTEDQVRPLANSLQTNPALKRLEIRGSGLFDHIYTTFAHVMPHNYWLEELKYNGCDYNVDPGVSLYLDLNRAGRKRFMLDANATREDWIEALIAFHYNTALVYCLLETNPSLLRGMGLNLTRSKRIEIE
jgi:hypothetical protein